MRVFPKPTTFLVQGIRSVPFLVHKAIAIRTQSGPVLEVTGVTSVNVTARKSHLCHYCQPQLSLTRLHQQSGRAGLVRGVVG
jgi:hypothetical protein